MLDTGSAKPPVASFFGFDADFVRCGWAHVCRRLGLTFAMYSPAQRLGLGVLAGLMAFAAWCGAIGCISTSSHTTEIYYRTAPTQVIDRAQLDRLRPGMSKDDFTEVAGPTQVEIARTQFGDEWVVAYQATLDHGVARNVRPPDDLWFYFYRGNLVRWGPPRDWPTEAELTRH